MAKMIPDYIEFNPKFKGEIELYNLLKGSKKTENWFVIHSLDISQHIKQVAGEMDFVIIVPHSGILCVEVKGSNKVSRDNQGNWHYGTYKKIDRRGPFKQASDGMYSLMNYVKGIDPLTKNIFFEYAVCFPFCAFNIETPEWKSWQVIDQKKLKTRDIGEIIYEILSFAKMYAESKNVIRSISANSEPSLAQCDNICKILKPEFNFSGSHQSNHDSLNKCYTKDNDCAENDHSNLDNHIKESDTFIFINAGKDLTAIEIEVNYIICNFSRTDFELYEITEKNSLKINFEPIYNLFNKIAYAYGMEFINSKDKLIVNKIIKIIIPIIGKDRIKGTIADTPKLFAKLLFAPIYLICNKDKKNNKRTFTFQYALGKVINYAINQLYYNKPIVDDDTIVAYEMGKLLGKNKYTCVS